MRIEVIFCPACNHKLRVPEDLMGAAVECPKCQATFIAPPPPGNGSGSDNPEVRLPSSMPDAAAEEMGALGNWRDVSQIPSSRSMVKRKAPGVALIVVAVLQLALFGYDFVSVVMRPDAARKAFEASQQAVANMGLPVQKPPFDPVKFSILVYALLALMAFVQLLGGVAIARGRLLWLGVLASTAALLNCLAVPCCAASVPVGLWCVIILLQADVRASFR